MKPLNTNKPVYWFSNIIVDKKKELQKFLSKNNVETRDMFLPLNKQPCFKNKNYIKNINSNFKNSIYIYQKGLSLPSHYNLTIKDLKYVVNKINIFFNN